MKIITNIQQQTKHNKSTKHKQQTINNKHSTTKTITKQQITKTY